MAPASQRGPILRAWDVPMILTLLFAAAVSAAPVAPVPLPDTLSLEWLEREALSRNPSLAAMRAGTDAARARARATGGLMDPMVEGMFGETGDNGEPRMLRFEARQKLTPFGQRGLERGVMRAEAGMSAREAEAAKLDLLREVREAFFELYRVTRALDTNTAQAELVGQFRRVALARYASGSEGQSDVLEADAELAMLVHEESMLQREHRVLDARLNALIHRSPADTLPPPPAVLRLPAAPDSAWLARLAPAASPELRAAEARVAAAEARLSLARRMRLPELEIGAAAERKPMLVGHVVETEWERELMVGVTLPLWQGARSAAEAEARAEHARAGYERAARADALAQELEQARAEYEESLHELEVLETLALPTAERALAAARSGFESGKGNFLTLTNAARRRGTVRLEQEAARVRVANGWAELRRLAASDLNAADAPQERRP